MRVIQTPVVLITVMVACFLSCSSLTNKQEKPVLKGTSQQPKQAATLPTFTMTDVDGNAVELNSLKGKKVFVNLWATWCPPCRSEIPSIEGLANKVDTEHVAFVMLSLDENFDLAKKFARSENLTIPIYYPAEMLPALFKTDGIPATFIFDENGVLMKQNNGADNYDTQKYLNILSRK